MDHSTIDYAINVILGYLVFVLIWYAGKTTDKFLDL